MTTTPGEVTQLSVTLPGGPDVSVDEASELLRHAQERFSASPPPSSATPSTSSGARSYSSSETIEPYDTSLDYSQLGRPIDYVVLHAPTPSPTPSPQPEMALEEASLPAPEFPEPNSDTPTWVGHVLREIQIDALLFFRHFFRAFVDNSMPQFHVWGYHDWERDLYNATPDTSPPEVITQQGSLFFYGTETSGNPFLWAAERALLRRLVAFIDEHPDLPPRAREYRQVFVMFNDFHIEGGHTRAWIDSNRMHGALGLPFGPLPPLRRFQGYSPASPHFHCKCFRTERPVVDTKTYY